MLGSPGKTYKEDSWDENQMVFDLRGEQRSGDVDNPEFYTLGASGMINAFIEGMEVFSNKDGSKDPAEPSENVAGKMMFPNSGFRGPKWGENMIPICRPPAWMLPPPLPGPPPIGDYGPNPFIGGGGWPLPTIPPDSPILRPKPDIDPGFEIHPPFGPGSGSGSGIGWHGAMMMSAGYNDPNFGLPSDSGGSFIGTAICYAPCCIPPDIQPAIPPDGLFGPDMPLHGWGFPGYELTGMQEVTSILIIQQFICLTYVS
jgi:hypothetical protein